MDAILNKNAGYVLNYKNNTLIVDDLYFYNLIRYVDVSNTKNKELVFMNWMIVSRSEENWIGKANKRLAVTQ